MLLPILFPLLASVLIPVPPPTIAQFTIDTVEEEKVEHIEPLPLPVACSCVQYVKTRRHDAPLIDAERYQVATTTAFVGAVVKLFYPHSGVYHVAYVEYIDTTKNRILLAESNYEHCKITKRWVQLPHKKILGYM